MIDNAPNTQIRKNCGFGLRSHPIAELFPLMSDDELGTLAEDIHENGQREPIVLYEGMILDGRNRYAACRRAGVEPVTKPWDGRGLPHAFVASLNLHRRHLSESQRAMIATRMAPFLRGGSENQRSQQHHVNTTKDVLPQVEAAKLMNVSIGSVQRARQVLAHGTPDEIAAVDEGRASVTTLATSIRERRMSPQDRELSKERNGQAAQIRAALYAQFRDAIQTLSTMPTASDVVRIVRKKDLRGGVIARLPKALHWLKEFEDAWTQPE